MKRRDFLMSSGAALGVLSVRGWTTQTRLTPPEKGRIPVAFAMAPRATVIDFAGPWEVFQDVTIPERGATHEEAMPFELFTVAESREPVRATGGLHIIPDYTFEDAPAPRVIVVPALRGSEALWNWLRRASRSADVTTSVCTGAFQLARAGLLDGKAATTHHDFYEPFEKEFPGVRLKRGLRLVDNGDVVTAGGLTSGIDMALSIVERYWGRDVAERTAVYMEYESRGWISD